MVRPTIIVALFIIALASHSLQLTNASHISSGFVDLNKFLSRFIAEESQQGQEKTIDPIDEIPNVIEVVAEGSEDIGDSTVSVVETNEATAPAAVVTTTTTTSTTATNSPAVAATTSGDKSNHGKNTSKNNNSSGGHGKSSPSPGHGKGEKLAKCLNYCQGSGKKSSSTNDDRPCNRGCLFRQLLDVLIKDSSLKEPKDISLQCAKGEYI